MILTEYNEEEVLQAECYAGERAGIEKGRESGLREGLEQATTEYVTNMYASDFRPEQIAAALKLDLDKVTAILDKQGLL